MSDMRHVRLSALASELLTREYEVLADPGAFGRLAQEIIVVAIKKSIPMHTIIGVQGLQIANITRGT